MSGMPARNLGELELFSLLAIQHLGSEALGLAIRDEIEQRTGRRVSVGAGYATLARLAMRWPPRPSHSWRGGQPR
jgi:nucleotidyltransferase/DNA polymerase involved in DNA repair